MEKPVTTSTAVGSVDRRCSCTGPDGRRLGKACPKLAGRSNHGVWFYRVELPADQDGTRRPRRRAGFRSSTAAQNELDQVRELLAIPERDDPQALRRVGDLIAQALSAQQPIPEPTQVRQLLRARFPTLTHPTVAQWLTVWLGGRKNIARNTYRSYESHIRLYLTRYLGSVRLDKLRVEHVSDMFDMIAEANTEIAAARSSNDTERRQAVRYQRPVGATSMHRIRATLRKALNDAIRQELITFNPATWVELPPAHRPPALVWTPERISRWKATGQPPSSVMVWTPAQTGQFLDHILGHPMYALYHLIAYRGLRRGEACGLRWIDTDLDAGLIHVLNQIVQLGWDTDQSTPKTEESMATVALDPATTTELTEHRARQQAERAAHTSQGGTWVESGLVFTDVDGASLHPADVTAQFHLLTAAAGLPPIRLHDLRHGAATIALSAGVDMKVVQHLLRHADITTTSNLYTSVLDEVARAAATDLANAIPRRSNTAKS